MKKAITDDLNLPNGTQHELPWYPPICDGPGVNGEKFLPLNERDQLDVERKSVDYLKKTLLSYVNEGYTDKHEIGQRIISAMDKVGFRATDFWVYFGWVFRKPPLDGFWPLWPVSTGE